MVSNQSPTSNQARIDGYTIGRTLGSGFSAKVKLATSSDGTEYAIKIFRKDSPKWDENTFKLVKNEIESTAQFDFKHVVNYFHFSEDSTYYKNNGDRVQVAYIVQEIVSGGELFDYVANSGAFKEDECKYFFKQMLQAVNYIHSRGFSHRDLKPENILLSK